MKKEHLLYLKEINVSQLMLATIEKKYQLLASVANVKEFDDILISEIISGQNKEYFSLWGFTSTLMCKISIGTTSDTSLIVLFKLKQNIARFSIKQMNFDFGNLKEDSILDTSVRTFDHDVPYFIKASGINCHHLFEIIKKYFIANLNS
jgi:hypothetical protein